MYKWRDFYLMKVYDSDNKYIGVVEDITIDFYNKTIIGFIITPSSLFKKHCFVCKDSVTSIDNVMNIKGKSNFSGMKFKEIKYLDIIDKNEKLIGVLEDLIIDKDTFQIKGLVSSSGLFDKMFKGKDIIMLKDCSLYDNHILYEGSGSIKLKTLPHNIGRSNDVKKA